ncbi:cell division protein FtsB [Niveibacterium terrae]|uniref:cell division protein FtsB n=1 Tax=Niveibacterium terrae TaxID=3373598 RepID=UPI003A8F8E9A
MKWPTLILALLLAALQYPLWMGKGSWGTVRQLDQQLRSQREVNAKLEVRNAGMDAEVRDLKTGYDAIEERARYDLGMVKQGEVFVQLPTRKR